LAFRLQQRQSRSMLWHGTGGYEDDRRIGQLGERLSKDLTQRTNILINLPVLKDHDGAGVTIGLKNMYGVIHNPNKYHPNGCTPTSRI